MFFINATVDEGPYRDLSLPPTRVARASLPACSGGWSVNVGGGGRVLLNDPDDCDWDSRDEEPNPLAVLALGGRCAIAVSTP